MKGWHGRLLQVDLQRGTVQVEPLAAALLQRCLGGRALGLNLLGAELRRAPDDPLLPLVLAVGPLCGTAAPAAAQLAVVSRSPLTGTVACGSCGGIFPRQLKAAGYDAVRIVGRSPHPVALAITPQGGALLDAVALQGASVAATTAALAERGCAAAIGPAGENGVLCAGVVTADGHSFGRGGFGALLGAKQLKALVAAGDRPTAVAAPARLERAGADVLRLLRASPVLLGELGFAAFGTPALVDLLALRRMTPTANFRQTYFAGARNYAGPALRRAFAARPGGCPGCPVQCRLQAPSGAPLPGYEALSHFGALLCNDDLASIVAAHARCLDLGLEPLSAAATLATWGEAQGRFPRGAELPELLEAMARRRGAGELLALGAQRLAAALGCPERAMTVKGLELPAYDPRGAYGMALAYATGNFGGSHESAYPIAQEVLRKPVPCDRFSFAGKARLVKLAEDGNAALDALGVCRHVLLGAGLEEYADLLAAVTGIEYSARQLLTLGEEVWGEERRGNAANGFTAAADDLPARFFTEPGSSGGGIDIPPLDRDRFLEERCKYYRMRGLALEGDAPGGQP